MRQQREAGPAAAGNPCDEVRALGHLRVELAGDAALLQVIAKELGRERLVAGRIDGVEANQLAEELDGLVPQRNRCAQRRVPYITLCFDFSSSKANYSSCFASSVSSFRTDQSSG
jgi:hypothetical protein